MIVIPNDSTISSLTIELTVKEGEVEFIPVETTPAEFISNLKDKMTYEFDNELYSGKVTPNANYFVYKNNESASYGYAQNSSEIIRYVIQRGGIKKDQTFTKDEYESMYDESFFLDICNPDAMPNSTAFTFPQASLDYLVTLTCVEGTNDYPIDIKKAHDVIALIAPTQVPNDPYLDLSYGSDARIKLTMVSDSEMRITVSNTSSMLSLPVDTTIKFNEEVSIPEIEEFVNDSESTEGQEVLAKIKEKLNADNYTSEVVVDGTTYTTVSTKDYYYTNNPNATYENDIKIGANSAGLDEGHYTYTITDGVFTLGNKYDLESEETQYESKLISSNSIVSGFDSNFVYDTENDMYFYTLSAEEPNYFISAPAFYALVTGNEKVVGISEILCTYTLDNGDVSSINLSFYNGSNLLTSAKLSKFGSSEVSAIESYLDSIK